MPPVMRNAGSPLPGIFHLLLDIDRISSKVICEQNEGKHDLHAQIDKQQDQGEKNIPPGKGLEVQDQRKIPDTFSEIDLILGQHRWQTAVATHHGNAKKTKINITNNAAAAATTTATTTTAATTTTTTTTTTPPPPPAAPTPAPTTTTPTKKKKKKNKNRKTKNIDFKNLMYPLCNQDQASWKFSGCALSWRASSLSCTLGSAWKFKEGSGVSKPGATDGWSKQGATDGWSSTTCTAFNFQNVLFLAALFFMDHWHVSYPSVASK